MFYWIMDNNKHCYAKIHLSHCHTCNSGRGSRLESDNRWYGPFTSYDEAFACARSSRRNVDSCKFCHPQFAR